MEGQIMRRGTFKKLCFVLFLSLVVLGGYYVYEMKIKAVYHKYSRLLEEQERRERLQSVIMQRKGQGVNTRHGTNREMVDGVEFVINEKHKDPIPKHNGQNGNRIPLQDFNDQQRRMPEVRKEPEDKEINMEFIDDDSNHDVIDVANDGEQRLEKEHVKGVEFIVQHNGEGAQQSNEEVKVEKPYDDIKNQDQKNQEPNPKEDSPELKKIHELMKKYQEKIKLDTGAAQDSNERIIQKPKNTQPIPFKDNQVIPRDDTNKPNPQKDIQMGEINEGLNSQVWKIMQELGMEYPLTDNKISTLILSGKISAEIAQKLMEYHSRHSADMKARIQGQEPVIPPIVKPGENDIPERDDEPVQPVKGRRTRDPIYDVINLVDLEKESGLLFKCVDIKLMVNVTTICLHDPKTDKPISSSLFEKGIWEAQGLNEFQRALVACPSCNVVDLGSNLGVYSLTAAAYGRQVLAVEPMVQNIGPFLNSVQKNKFTKQITFLRNAISNKREYMEMKYAMPSTNLGAVYAVPIQENEMKTRGMNPNFVRAITLNDLTKLIKFKNVILKVDIQGAEHAMFQASNKFLEEIDVPFIFMHWAHEEYKKETLETAQYLIEKGYKPKITIGGSNVGVDALARDQGLIIWTKEYSNAGM